MSFSGKSTLRFVRLNLHSSIFLLYDTEIYLIFIPNHLCCTCSSRKQTNNSLCNSLCKKWESEGQSKAINAKQVTRTGNNKIQTNIEDLNPGTTYTVRLRVLSAVASESESPTPGKPSPELIIDTEAVSCTPKASQCVICWDSYCNWQQVERSFWGMWIRTEWEHYSAI